MSSMPQTAGMHELEKKAGPSGPKDKPIFDDPDARVGDSPSADATKEAAHFSPDPLKRTDRYRLVHPYSLKL